MRQLKVALFIGIALLTACNAPQSDMKKTSASDREAQPQSQAAPPAPTPTPTATPAPAPPEAAPAPDRARPPEVSEAAPGAHPHRHLDKRRVAARRLAPTAPIPVEATVAEPLPEAAPPPLPPPPPPPPPPPATQTCPDGSVLDATSMCPALPAQFVGIATLIPRGQSFVSVGGGYATILLTSGHAMRTRAACDKLVSSMETTAEVATPKPKVIDGTLVYERPVYWLVKSATPVDCGKMVANYDFERAAINLHRIPGWQTFGPGPFVVVWREGGTQAGVFDFSRVPTIDFGNQFQAVSEYMARRSDVWDPRFYEAATLKQTMQLYLLEGSPAAELFAKLFKLG